MNNIKTLYCIHFLIFNLILIIDIIKYYYLYFIIILSKTCMPVCEAACCTTGIQRLATI